MSENTITAIATPPGMGAVAIIRISGKSSLNIARQLFSPLPESPQARYQYFGKCLDRDGASIDEVLLSWFEGPKSFTGEDVVEIACHGGTVVTQCLLERILELGAIPAEPGEFTQRAFLNGKIDLTQAEAIMDLISAQTELAVKAAGSQLAGKLGAEMEELRQEMIGISAHVEAYIDFPDEDIDPESQAAISRRIESVCERIRRLLATADRGRILREGIRTVLCGAPNAGKSSLLNYLVGFDRAIVSSRPGTTRDTIEETISLDGIPLRMIDTAGIRESDDEIEQQGIERSRSQVEQAELVLLLVDSTRPRADIENIAIAEDSKVVRILNKSDLAPHSDWADRSSSVPVSCLTGEGMDELRKAIVRTVTGAEAGFERGDLVAINTRHQHFLKKALVNMNDSLVRLQENDSPEFVSFEIREALESVGAVVGKTDVEEILGSIFSTFCIGK
ncbi:MAG: tRNA uridine-5-carboxymethylaminomethyl(34) synthesis GTPase MnmE [Verrucomicrobiales bacterium]|nr:tRNA uridine-5-carboxymethylaminomethyl(34) synthesis GTPase MnmE [Verrucomicrobiales bacterium]